MRGSSRLTMSAGVDVRRGCQLSNRSGCGQGSSGSRGRSAHFHQTCRFEQPQTMRQVRRSSSSRRHRTKAPASNGLSQAGQIGIESIGILVPGPAVTNTPSCLRSTLGWYPVWSGGCDLGVRRWRLRGDCHCRSSLVGLGRPRDGPRAITELRITGEVAGSSPVGRRLTWRVHAAPTASRRSLNPLPPGPGLRFNGRFPT